jgi:diadenosine tetraphosphatase ApaH/serine/threonine PP2A family protein phosphatase
MFAVLSDIHANLEALTAVLADIDRLGVERVLCLGDLVGYGPDPVACIDLVRRRCEVVVMGNFDQALGMNIDGYSPPAAQSVYWTRSHLDSPTESQDVRDQRWAFLTELPPTFREGDTLYVHGSARNPLHEYVFPEDIYNGRKMERIFELIPHVCFCGHTHVQGVLLDHAGRYDIKTQMFFPTGGEGEYAYFAPEEVGHEWRIGENKTIINVGSVGQPRDGDPRAGYVLVEGGHVQFRRVEYDYETTIRKIYDLSDLENFLGDRLRDGR